MLKVNSDQKKKTFFSNATYLLLATIDLKSDFCLQCFNYYALKKT